jgi:AcrR family transcriptional regulator
MIKKAPGRPRRAESLSRDRIIHASIEILDSSGEAGLTFRALSERLATGPGALYGYIANKSELLTAACDAIIARTMEACAIGTEPEKTIRALALGIFDAIDAHPWIGSVLTLTPGQLPMVRILEGIGQQVRALGVPDKGQWATVSALMNYILGVAGQNAANGQHARTRGLHRTDFLITLSTIWSQLDPHAYPFTRSVAGQLPAHDDRLDFLAGIDLILRGMDAPQLR